MCTEMFFGSVHKCGQNPHCNRCSLRLGFFNNCVSSVSDWEAPGLACFTPPPREDTAALSALLAVAACHVVWAVRSFELVGAPQRGPLLRLLSSLWRCSIFPAFLSKLRASAAPSDTPFANNVELADLHPWCEMMVNLCLTRLSQRGRYRCTFKIMTGLQ